MKTIIIILVLFISLSCTKQEKSENQNADRVKTSGSPPTENVKQTNQPVKTYKKGEPIELYDLIYMLLPDEGETGNFVNISILNELKAVKWDNKSFGHLNVMINGIKEQNDWTVFLDEKKELNSQTRIEMSVGFESHGIGGGDIDCEESLPLEYSFPNQNYHSILIKKEECLGGYGTAQYEVKIPNKKTCWIVAVYSSGSRSGDWGRVIYTDKNEIDKY